MTRSLLHLCFVALKDEHKQYLGNLSLMEIPWDILVEDENELCVNKREKGLELFTERFVCENSREILEKPAYIRECIMRGDLSNTTDFIPHNMDFYEHYLPSSFFLCNLHNIVYVLGLQYEEFSETDLWKAYEVKSKNDGLSIFSNYRSLHFYLALFEVKDIKFLQGSEEYDKVLEIKAFLFGEDMIKNNNSKRLLYARGYTEDILLENSYDVLAGFFRKLHRHSKLFRFANGTICEEDLYMNSLYGYFYSRNKRALMKSIDDFSFSTIVKCVINYSRGLPSDFLVRIYKLIVSIREDVVFQCMFGRGVSKEEYVYKFLSFCIIQNLGYVVTIKTLLHYIKPFDFPKKKRLLILNASSKKHLYPISFELIQKELIPILV